MTAINTEEPYAPSCSLQNVGSLHIDRGTLKNLGLAQLDSQSARICEQGSITTRVARLRINGVVLEEIDGQCVLTSPPSERKHQEQLTVMHSNLTQMTGNVSLSLASEKRADNTGIL